MKKVALALALTLAAGAASAHDTVLSFGTFEKAGITTEGLMFDAEGSIGSFNYELGAFDGNANGIDANAATLDVNWTGLALGTVDVGPALSYGYAEVGGISDEGFAGGAAMRTELGSVAVKGDLLISFEDSDAWSASIDGRVPVGERLTAMAAYSYVDDGAVTESHTVELGGRYDLNAGTFLEATVETERSRGTTGTGANLGLGFKF